MTPARIAPATFRFVAQHLNHCATAVPQKYEVQKINSHTEEPVGFVVDILVVNIFFFQYFGLLSSL